MHFFFFNDTATTEIYTLSLHDALPIAVANPSPGSALVSGFCFAARTSLALRRFGGSCGVFSARTPAARPFYAALLGCAEATPGQDQKLLVQPDSIRTVDTTLPIRLPCYSERVVSERPARCVPGAWLSPTRSSAFPDAEPPRPSHCIRSYFALSPAA